jgi:hypothetical protein
MKVVILDADIARALNELIKRAEREGHVLTEFEDEMHYILIDSINSAAKIIEDQR